MIRQMKNWWVTLTFSFTLSVLSKELLTAKYVLVIERCKRPLIFYIVSLVDMNDQNGKYFQIKINLTFRITKNMNNFRTSLIEQTNWPNWIKSWKKKLANIGCNELWTIDVSTPLLILSKFRNASVKWNWKQKTHSHLGLYAMSYLSIS